LTAAVKVPHALVLAIGAGGIAMIVGGFVPWRTVLRWIWRQMGRLVQGVLENGRNQAAAQACQVAADLLDGLLAEHSRWSETRRWSQRFAGRGLISDYERNGRQVVLNAIHKAWETESVPPWAIRYAERDRTPFMGPPDLVPGSWTGFVRGWVA
jgi:hypothetical protein